MHSVKGLVHQKTGTDRQLRSRRVEFEIETFKGEVEPMLRRIADLCGRDRFCKLSE